MKNNKDTTTAGMLSDAEIDNMSEAALREHLRSLGHDPDQQLAMFSAAIGAMKCHAALQATPNTSSPETAPAPIVETLAPHFDHVPYIYQLVSAGRGQWVPSSDSAKGTTCTDLFGKQNWQRTAFAKVRGDSMSPSGIHDGDSILIELGCEARDGDIVLVHTAELGEVVKRLRVDQDGPWLESTNPAYPPIRLGEPDSYSIQGVVRGRAGRLP